ncbi:ADP-ribose pyrophosphatase, mitochondrial isoform X1 [Photinus pyralis]|uniref:ADP-ribose pyrophosphatase, mitochondrial isoform X1 n=1 Tax=Photinus pyralis TaxID=7054 RepID=UPI001267398F|nr:ADP-ribose pyrophosphatase, mitochondrial isoform X1 [Photinus pyralis]
MIIRKMVHIKCRSNYYPFGAIKRLNFPDNLVPWTAAFNEYNPPEYNSPNLLGKPWADPDIADPKFHPHWNELDGAVNRKSHMGVYPVTDGKPLNPRGRTGLTGRGVLGRWGPNHAADPVVTRWKLCDDGKREIDQSTNLYILQFCAIKRRDSDEWALPGGMVDPGEHVSSTLQREFLEEALNSLESSPAELESNKKMIANFFTSGNEIYKGYVDDPRNTDNAWMETVAVNFHDEDGNLVGKFRLNAGDDAKSVQWMDIDQSLALYASHSLFIQTAAMLHGAHW